MVKQQEIKQCDKIGDTLRSKETFCNDLGFVIIIFLIRNGIYNDNVGIQVNQGEIGGEKK